MQLTVQRTIDAPIDRVFDTVAHIENFSQAVPSIVRAEILSEVKTGAGTRFRETRLMGGREATTELEVTEYVANDRVRIVADSHGTVWDTLFTVRPEGDATELVIAMDARPHTLVTRIMTPIMKGFFRKGMEKHIDEVRAHCEAASV